ncbi:MAG TPA: ABC transporter permease [Vicinamibacteria bacterium]|nr:ABC transporter permease [Vicinamibacteria bacterium]
MESLWRDVRYGARMLGRSPAFTAVAVLTLALGIGANTAIFSVIHAVLLRSLPYEDADRLVFLTEWSEQVPQMSFSIANLKDVQDQNTVFESLAGYNGQNLILGGENGEAERVNGRQVTSGLFATLGKKPIVGRPFTAEEDKPGAEGVVLLGEGFWDRRFGRDPGVVGRRLVLSDEPFIVIGVMPGSLHGSWKAADVFTPLLRLEDRLGGEENRGNHPGIYVTARLKAGVSEEAARSEVKSIAARLAEQHPKTNARQSMTLETLHEAFVGDLRPALMLLAGAVTFVLLIACANVANLLLARAASRAREIAVRGAMGAQRARLLRQLLTESLLLSLLGAVVGVVFAYAGVRGLVASLPANVPRADEIRVDGWVLAFTAGLAMVTGLIFGLAPAWKVSRQGVQDALREGGRGTPGPGHHRVRNTLVVAQVSLALVLLVGAGLMLRSFARVLAADAGFRAEGVLTASIPLPPGRFPEAASRAAFVRRVVEEVEAVPGVEAASAALPLLGGWQSSFRLEGRPEPPPGQLPSADITRVTPDYFRAMGVRLREGRVFTDRDTADAPPVAIVDETFARAHCPGEGALGRRLRFGALDNKDAKWLEIVGVVGHVKNYGVDEDSRVEVYLPYDQSPVSGVTLVVRASADPASLSGPLRAAVKAADPELPLYAVRTLPEIVSDRTAQRRLAATLITVFAVVALVLAGVGIYGVMSYAVAQRTQEIGIRMALGAERREILRMVLRHGALMAVSGVALGLVAASVLARLITSLLFQTSAADPPTFSVVPVVLIAVALLACWIPARRATRVDPLVALRYP